MDSIKKELEAALEVIAKSVDKRYQNPDGSFKKTTPVGKPSGKKNAFNMCVKKLMADGKSKKSAESICGTIAKKKYGSIQDAEIDAKKLGDLVEKLEKAIEKKVPLKI